MGIVKLYVFPTGYFIIIYDDSKIYILLTTVNIIFSQV